MGKALFLSVFALVAVPAVGAEPTQCDATAFTLKKPVPPAPKAEKPKPQPKISTAQAAPRTAKPKKTTTRLISDCKDGEKKKGG